MGKNNFSEEEGRSFILDYINQHGIDNERGTDAALPPMPQKKSPKKEKLPLKKIDLHGLTSDVAARVFSDAVLSAKKNGIRKLLIVHGRGINSDPDTGPVLKRLVEIMVDHELKPIVREWQKAPAHLGGDGATIITLR